MTKRYTRLAAWLDTRIGPSKKYSSNYEFAEAIGISELTVRCMRDGEFPRMRAFQQMNRAEPEFSQLLLQQLHGSLPTDPEDQRAAVLLYLADVLDRLPQEDQDLLLNIAKHMLEQQKRADEADHSEPPALTFP